ncbi:MAG: diaminopimelate epimerase [Myxococcales bacterium]|nr:diaminopimelate epimerase [Myxococcales bacterium]
MGAFSFVKYHGLGNDFVLVDDRDAARSWGPEEAQEICDRHRGIGGDGLILVQSSEQAPLRMVIYNADGSRPEMCGNGLRCFARYVRESEMIGKDTFSVETDRGVLVCEITRDAMGEIEGVRVDMGAPILERSQVPMLGDGGRCLEEPLTLEDREYQISGISMGNPHMVIFKQPDERDLVLAPRLESHPSFPQRTNVEFVEQHAPEHFGVVVYERGCGFTQACGTGACAVGVAAVLTERAKADQELRVDLPGGPLWITVPSDLSTVWMRGPAAFVFAGRWGR